MSIKETKKVTISHGDSVRHKLRRLSKNEFIEQHSSGTLRKSYKLGFNVDYQYYHERVAYEIGWGFDIYNILDNKVLDDAGFIDSKLKTGKINAIPDDHITTEIGWVVERHLTINEFPEDKYELMTYKGEPVLVLTQTSLDIPEGCVVMACLTEMDCVVNIS